MAKKATKKAASPKKAKKVTASKSSSKTADELGTRLGELKKEQFNLRFQKASGQLSNTAQIARVRKEIAQIKTMLGERRKAS